MQIKITQGGSVDIMDVPDYLLVLFLNKSDRNVYEVNVDGKTYYIYRRN